jgi:hypothetical protein
MNKIVCHLGDPRQSKPDTLQEYGKLRKKMIQRPWEAVSEVDFIRLVTEKGCPFYGALLNGRDLMDLQFEKLCWRTQTLVGLDFDFCIVPGKDMVQWFDFFAMKPWLGYFTFPTTVASATSPTACSGVLIPTSTCLMTNALAL